MIVTCSRMVMYVCIIPNTAKAWLPPTSAIPLASPAGFSSIAKRSRSGHALFNPTEADMDLFFHTFFEVMPKEACRRLSGRDRDRRCGSTSGAGSSAQGFYRNLALLRPQQHHHRFFRSAPVLLPKGKPPARCASNFASKSWGANLLQRTRDVLPLKLRYRRVHVLSQKPHTEPEDIVLLLRNKYHGGGWKSPAREWSVTSA